MLRLLLPFTALLLLVVSLPAQRLSGEPAARKTRTAAAPDAEANPAQLLERLLEKPHALEGKVVIHEPLDDSPGFTRIGGRADAGKPYRGAFTLHRTDRGERLFASSKAIPGVAIYQAGKEVVARSTVTTNAPISMTDLQQDLQALLAYEKLMKTVLQADAWKTADGADGASTVHRVALPAKLFRMRSHGGSDMPGFGAEPNPLAKRILRGQLALTVDAEGEVRKLELRVVRNDPGAAIQELIEEGGADGGDGTYRLNPADLAGREPIEGAMHVYTMKPCIASDQGRAMKLLSEFREGLTQR